MHLVAIDSTAVIEFGDTVEVLRYCIDLVSLLSKLVFEYVNVSEANFALIVIGQNFHSVHDEV